MRLPDVQAELKTLADDLFETHPWQALRIVELADEIRRRETKHRTPPHSTPMSPALARRIRAYRHAHPSLSFQAIAVHFKVNAGRVSEAISGKRR